MSKIKISIIIPVYNCERYIGECLDSVIYQKFKDYEVIVVNDGSTDNSEKIIDRYCNKYSKIRTIKTENGGLGKARNCGIAQAKGEYLFFLDGDDLITENSLDILYNEVVKNPGVDLVMGNMCLMNEEGIVRMKEFDTIFNREMIVKDLKYYHCIMAAQTACNKLIKKSLLKNKKIEFPIGLVHEDLNFSPILYYYCKNISIIKDDVYIYRKFSENISITTNINEEFYFEDRIKIIQRVYDFLDTIDDERYKEIFYLYVVKKFLVPFVNKLFYEYNESFSYKAFNMMTEIMERIDDEIIIEAKIKKVEYLYIKYGMYEQFKDYRIKNKKSLVIRNNSVLININDIKHSVGDVTSTFLDKTQIKCKIENVDINKNTMKLDGFVFLQDVSTNEKDFICKEIYLENMNERSEKYKFNLIDVERPDVTKVFGKYNNYDRSGFSAVLNIINIKDLNNKNFDLFISYYIGGIEKKSKIAIEEKYFNRLLLNCKKETLLKVTNFSTQTENRRQNQIKSTLIKNIDLGTTVILPEKNKKNNVEDELISVNNIGNKDICSKNGGNNRNFTVAAGTKK